MNTITYFNSRIQYMYHWTRGAFVFPAILLGIERCHGDLRGNKLLQGVKGSSPSISRSPADRKSLFEALL
jgi:hypothetical protein